MIFVSAFLKAFKICLFPQKQWQIIYREKTNDSSDVFQNAIFPLLFIVVVLLIMVLGVSKQSMAMGIAGFSLLTISHTIMVGLSNKILKSKENEQLKLNVFQLITFSSFPIWMCLPMVPFGISLYLLFIIGFCVSLWLLHVGFNQLKVENSLRNSRFLILFSGGALFFYGLCFLLLQAFYRVIN